MKKVLSCLLAVLLLASFSVMAFAADPVPSVEAEKVAPEVSEAVDAEENDVSDAIIVTDLADKEELSDEAQEEMDAAVEALEEVDAVVEGNEELKELVGDKEVAVESVFNISSTGEVAFPLELKLQLDNPENFAALLQFVDGEAQLVETELEDDVISFTVDSLGTFAILSFVEAE